MRENSVITSANYSCVGLGIWERYPTPIPKEGCPEVGLEHTLTLWDDGVGQKGGSQSSILSGALSSTGWHPRQDFSELRGWRLSMELDFAHLLAEVKFSLSKHPQQFWGNESISPGPSLRHQALMQ